MADIRSPVASTGCGAPLATCKLGPFSAFGPGLQIRGRSLRFRQPPVCSTEASRQCAHAPQRVPPSMPGGSRGKRLVEEGVDQVCWDELRHSNLALACFLRCYIHDNVRLFWTLDYLPLKAGWSEGAICVAHPSCSSFYPLRAPESALPPPLNPNIIDLRESISSAAQAA
jgi:hypothetical protein